MEWGKRVGMANEEFFRKSSFFIISKELKIETADIDRERLIHKKPNEEEEGERLCVSRRGWSWEISVGWNVESLKFDLLLVFLCPWQKL